MADNEFTLDSGAKLHVTVCPFSDVMALQKAFAAALKGVPFTADPLSMDITHLKDAVLAVLESNAVEAALWKCLDRCAYNKERVTPRLFDDRPEARADFYAICWKCIEVNLSPFFRQTFSRLKASGLTPAAILK